MAAVPKNFRPTMLDRAIGRTLAGWRKIHELSLTEAGRRVGFSSAKLSMMENAIQPSAGVDIMALGYVYRVPAPEWQEMVEKAQLAERLRILDPIDHGNGLDAAADFASIYSQTVRLRAYRNDIIPDVLQTYDYTRAAMKANEPERAAVIATRQLMVNNAWLARLHDNEPLELEVIVTESAIDQTIGGPRIKEAQLLHLLQLGELPSVKIQVLTHDALGYPIVGFPFVILSFPHRQHGDVVYVEDFLKSRYIENSRECELCEQKFASMQQVALDHSESLEFIAERASSSHPTNKPSSANAEPAGQVLNETARC